MNRNKPNRGRGREKRRLAKDSRRPSQATARRVRGHEPFQPGADRRPGADPRGYRTGGERPAHNRMTCVAVTHGAYDSAAIHQRPREAGKGAGASCFAKQRPCSGSEAGAELRHWVGSLVKRLGLGTSGVRLFPFRELSSL